VTEIPTLTRRGLIVAGSATVAGASAFALAACSTAAEDPTTSDSPPEGLQSGTELAELADIPVGGSVGVQVDGSAVLLSQPQDGEAKAFSAICRHQGCVVAAAGASLDCPCHGSRYDAATGEVLNGPSTLPLIAIEVTVVDGRVMVA
jgi:Rieske Fe-S protein